MKKVSVVIPAYNIEGTPELRRYFVEALQSVNSQTVKPYEVIVVDDKSTDDTASFAESVCLVNGIDNFIVHVRSENGGIGAARHSGVDLASGDYIAFLSSDDMWESRFLEYSLRHVSRFHASFSDYYVCNEKLFPISKFAAPKYDSFEELKRLCACWALKRNMFVNFSSVVLPKNIFNSINFRYDLRHGEDLVFLLESLVYNLSYIHIAFPLVYYRLHGGQGTNFHNNFREWSLMWRYLYNLLPEFGVSDMRLAAAYIDSYELHFKADFFAVARKTVKNLLPTQARLLVKKRLGL